ncbi:MAG TPA: hypothetical protein VLM79_33210, partial [Kofleriaceae bacterium]|nr:hypothetical protein [Kofleriaceae bacterium]
LVGQLYACYSDVWTDGIAHDADRLCAGIPCFDNSPEPCLWQSGSPGTPATIHACTDESCPLEESYLGCNAHAGEQRWDHAITVFLNDPCDLSTDLCSCQKSYRRKTEACNTPGQ